MARLPFGDGQVTGEPVRPSVAALNNPAAFTLLETVDHAQIPQWVAPHIYTWRTIPLVYWALNVAIAILVWETGRRSGLAWPDAASTFFLGVGVGFIVLLPIHEHLHALAYRWQGATRVEVRYLWRQLTALCVAPGEVLSGRAFLPVCLTPLLVINTVLFVVWWIAPSGQLALALSGALLLHTGAASGDVAFVQYVASHGTTGIFTYDDEVAAKTYFYRRTTDGNL
jgi:hypothetical protein